MDRSNLTFGFVVLILLGCCAFSGIYSLRWSNSVAHVEFSDDVNSDGCCELAAFSDDLLVFRFRHQTDWPKQSFCDLQVMIPQDVAKVVEIERILVYDQSQSGEFLESNMRPYVAELGNDTKWKLHTALEDFEFEVEMKLSLDNSTLSLMEVVKCILDNSDNVLNLKRSSDFSVVKYISSM